MQIIGEILLISLAASHNGQEDSFTHYLSQLESLPDQIDSTHLQNSLVVKQLVLAHSKALPDLRRALDQAPSWKVRLAACYVIKEMGRLTSLLPATNDRNSFVRNFARAALKHKPRKWGDDSSAPEAYSIDPALTDWASTLLDSSIPFTREERKVRIQSTLVDLLNIPDPFSSSREVQTDAFMAACRLARAEPDAYAAALSANAKVSNDAGTIIRSLNVMTVMISGSREPGESFYEGAQDLIASAMSDPRPDVRRAGFETGIVLAPLGERKGIFLRGLADSSPSVREGLLNCGLSLVREYEEKGYSKEADEVLEAVKELYLTSEKSPGVNGSIKHIRRLEEQLSSDRSKLREGLEDDGATMRFLRVDKNLVQVREEEYQLALEWHGKPYVSESQFRSIRSFVHLSKERETDASSSGEPRQQSTLHSSRTTEDSSVAMPTEQEVEEPKKDPSVWPRIIGGGVIALLLLSSGLVFLRLRRGAIS